MLSFPVAVGALFSHFLPRPILKTESFGLFNIYLEFLIKRSRFEFVKKIKRSKISATLIFSMLNVIIMCGMFKASCPNFWFSKFKYDDSQETTTTDICDRFHKNLTCRNFFNEVKVTPPTMTLKLINLRCLF